jgi:hypothetical protein
MEQSPTWLRVFLAVRDRERNLHLGDAVGIPSFRLAISDNLGQHLAILPGRSSLASLFSIIGGEEYRSFGEL